MRGVSGQNEALQSRERDWFDLVLAQVLAIRPAHGIHEFQMRERTARQHGHSSVEDMYVGPGEVACAEYDRESFEYWRDDYGPTVLKIYVLKSVCCDGERVKSLRKYPYID